MAAEPIPISKGIREHRQQTITQTDFAGRTMFLMVLRQRWPSFWKSLNNVWRSRDYKSIQPWLISHSVRDEWLVDVIEQTLNAWERDPDGPNARLEPENLWFFYFEDESEAYDFVPRFTDPSPRYGAKGGQCYTGKNVAVALHQVDPKKLEPIRSEIRVETLKEFELRMKREFNEQLRDYIRQLKADDYIDQRSELLKHAEWTVLVMSGMSPVKIAQNWLGFRNDTNIEFPEKTVRLAVKRFAESIGLTLP